MIAPLHPDFDVHSFIDLAKDQINYLVENRREKNFRKGFKVTAWEFMKFNLPVVEQRYWKAVAQISLDLEIYHGEAKKKIQS